MTARRSHILPLPLRAWAAKRTKVGGGYYLDVMKRIDTQALVFEFEDATNVDLLDYH
jgi:hypothetical protein